MKGTDSFATIRPEWVPQLKALGYGFAARYYRRAPLTGGKGNAVSKSEVDALHACGMGFLPVYQNTSDKPEYFTFDNADKDAEAACAKADEMGQPAGSTIFFAVDCDPAPNQMAAVLGYFNRLVLRVNGWRVGVYGSGAVCQELEHGGFVDLTWLANAKGWRGYQTWLPHADVVQTTLPFTLPFGLQVDGNECRNERCLWMPEAPVVPQPSIWERVTGWFR